MQKIQNTDKINIAHLQKVAQSGFWNEAFECQHMNLPMPQFPHLKTRRGTSTATPWHSLKGVLSKSHCLQCLSHRDAGKASWCFHPYFPVTAWTHNCQSQGGQCRSRNTLQSSVTNPIDVIKCQTSKHTSGKQSVQEPDSWTVWKSLSLHSCSYIYYFLPAFPLTQGV